MGCKRWSHTWEDHGDLQGLLETIALHYQIRELIKCLLIKGFEYVLVVGGVGQRDLLVRRKMNNIFWGFATGNQSSIFQGSFKIIFRDQPGDTYYRAGNMLTPINNLDAYFSRPLYKQCSTKQ